jgi:hypothetical protein
MMDDAPQDRQQDQQQDQGETLGQQLEQREANQPPSVFIPVANIARVHELLDTIAHRERGLVTQVRALLASV